MKISYAVLFILISTLCVFGQKSPAKRITKKSPAKTSAKTSVNTPANKVVTCEQMFDTVADKMTDDEPLMVSKGTFPIRNGNSGFNVTLVKKPKDNVGMVVFTVIENGSKTCLSQSAEMIFLFTDGSKVSRRGFNSFNCEGRTFFAMDSSTDLKNKMVETIRISTYKGHVQADFTPLQAKILFAEVNCLFPSND